jgi:hypothetical protein
MSYLHVVIKVVLPEDDTQIIMPVYSTYDPNCAIKKCAELEQELNEESKRNNKEKYALWNVIQYHGTHCECNKCTKYDEMAYLNDNDNTIFQIIDVELPL